MVLVVLVLVLVTAAAAVAAAADGGPGAGGPAATKNCPRNKFPITEKCAPAAARMVGKRVMHAVPLLCKRLSVSGLPDLVVGLVAGVVVGVKATSFSLAPSALLSAGVGGFIWHKHVNQFSGV